MLETSSLAAATTASCAMRLQQHMLGLLLCPAKSTVSNLICTRGGQHGDWSADYRLYSRDRVDESVLFGRVRDTLIENLAPGEPLVVALDDTLNRKTLELLEILRRETPSARHLIITGDGSYTNKTMLRGMPEGSTYIGRGRKDIVVHYPPATLVAGVNGRPPRYGALAPTPLKLHKDDSVPWQYVEAFAAGKRHNFRVKTMNPVLWRKDRTLDGNLPSTGDLLRLLRYETWAGAIRPGTLHAFVTKVPPNTNAQNPRSSLPATLFAAA